VRDSLAVIAVIALGAACGRAASAPLVAIPDRLTLLGPGHGRTIALYDPHSLESVTAEGAVSSDPKVVEVAGTRVRAKSSGSAEVAFRAKSGAEALVEIEVGGEPAPFVQSIVDLERGEGDGFGRDRLPDVVLGPPKGAGENQGSTDVLSLGVGGSITVAFGSLRICDGPGPDFIVFENAFRVGGADEVYAEPARVEVSGEGAAFVGFDCDARAAPHRGCAGVHPVIAGPGSPAIDPTDPEQAGGDPFDLEGRLALADRVRITDAKTGTITPSGTSGFDLDAVALACAAPDDAAALEADPPAIVLRRGETIAVPRADLVRRTGARIRGVRARTALASGDLAKLEGERIHAISPGTTTLILSLADLMARVSIEVQ
jgi:hypothetical protein